MPINEDITDLVIEDEGAGLHGILWTCVLYYHIWWMPMDRPQVFAQTLIKCAALFVRTKQLFYTNGVAELYVS